MTKEQLREFERSKEIIAKMYDGIISRKEGLLAHLTQMIEVLDSERARIRRQIDEDIKSQSSIRTMVKP